MLKIVLPDKQARNLILHQAQILIFMKCTKVFIVPARHDTHRMGSTEGASCGKRLKEKEWGRCGNLQGHDCHKKEENQLGLKKNEAVKTF